jgi:hypothetical protein
MVTARHVIEEAEKRERLRTGNRRISNLRQDIFALYMIAHHADGRVCGGKNAEHEENAPYDHHAPYDHQTPDDRHDDEVVL